MNPHWTSFNQKASKEGFAWHSRYANKRETNRRAIGERL